MFRIFFISRGVKMRISAREACVKPHLHTRSVNFLRYGAEIDDSM